MPNDEQLNKPFLHRFGMMISGAARTYKDRATNQIGVYRPLQRIIFVKRRRARVFLPPRFDTQARMRLETHAE